MFNLYFNPKENRYIRATKFMYETIYKAQGFMPVGEYNVQTNTTADTANTGPVIKNIDFAIHTIIQNAKNVQAVIDSSFAYVSAKKYDEHVASKAPHPNIPNHLLNVTSTDNFWVTDNDSHLHKMPLENVRQIVLGDTLNNEVVDNSAQINELKLFVMSCHELGLNANLLHIEDFQPATTVDDFKTKVISCTQGGRLIGVESGDDIVKGARYWITDGVKSELVTIAGVAYSTDYYHVTTVDGLGNNYNLANTYLKRSTFDGVLVDTKYVSWSPRNSFKGIAANIERELVLDTAHRNRYALKIEGEGLVTTDGYFTLENSYGGFELTDAEDVDGFEYLTEEEIATVFEEN